MKDLVKLLESMAEIFASLKLHQSIIEQKARKKELRNELREMRNELKELRIQKKINKRKSKLKT